MVKTPSFVLIQSIPIPDTFQAMFLSQSDAQSCSLLLVSEVIL